MTCTEPKPNGKKSLSGKSCGGAKLTIRQADEAGGRRRDEKKNTTQLGLQIDVAPAGGVPPFRAAFGAELQ